ncbi:unnamed protein product [Cyclocybe aegerita]|uniref:CNNM transmembrane domain-containing protein n=1 Tax=Cyclocybe aegerita TaxID=1973307 RepID=A0A8S0VXY9_CYCAE|nr:unnamed protein product [Cyclocybe aegerita]
MPLPLLLSVLCLTIAARAPSANGLPLTTCLSLDECGPIYRVAGKHKTGHPGAEPGSPEFWYHVGVSACLVLAGGVFAGLTLGLMGLDELHLRVLATSSEDKRERRNAQTVLKLMQKGKHWVLVVLLLCNVIVNESLPIFLDSAIGGGYLAIAISTTAIAIGARCASLVLGLMYILAPVAWPIARLLDAVLGTHTHTTYKKAELKSFLQFHRTGDEPLRDEEITILNGVLELNTKKVESIMTPLKDTVILAANAILDYPAVHAILQSGYSRIPVHEKCNKDAFIGILLVKKLLTYDPKRALPVSAFPLSVLPEASPSINCFQALDYFQTGRAHLLLISRTPGKPGGAIGVITLEDVIEEIISEEIVDETDLYEDNHSKRRVRRIWPTRTLSGIVEHRRRRRSSFLETSSLVESIVTRSGSVDARAAIHYGSVTPTKSVESIKAHSTESRALKWFQSNARASSFMPQ